MTPEEPSHAGPGTWSRSATAVILILLFFTLALVVLSFPAGLYVVFHGGLPSAITYGSLVYPYFWLGPVPEISPFAVQFGGVFLALTLTYVGFLVLGLVQPQDPLGAIRGAFRNGVGVLTGSPFFVTLIAIGFLNFSALIITAVSEAAAGPVGNPFSTIDPLLEFGSLALAPLREEFGFRMVLIGLVALVLSIGKPPAGALKSLWRPSAAYEGLAVGGATAAIIWLATAASAVTFGVCHVNCGGGGGWNWSKFPEAAWGGLVLGFLYVKYGFHVAVLTHWGVDYLGSVFAFYGQAAYGIPFNSSTTEYVGQYLVDIDMLLLFGLASFILVAYLGVKKYLARRGARETVLVDKGPPPGVVPQT